MSELSYALWELHDASYIEEDSYGTTPSSPSMKSLWHNTVSLEPKRDALRSDRRLGDRTRSLSRLGFKRCEGSIDSELTAGNHDDFLEMLFCGRFVTTTFSQISGQTFSCTASTQTLEDSGSGMGAVEVGDWIIVAGFTETVNNGVFHVSAASAASLTLEWGAAALVDEAVGDTVTIDQQNRLEANSDWPAEGPFLDVGPKTTIAAVNSTSKFTDSGSGFGEIEVGDWVLVTGFVTAANNGIFEVTAAAAGEITVDATLTDESVGPSVTVKQKLFRSMTVEGRYKDQSLYHRFLGVMVKNGAFNLTPENIVTCSFSLLGCDFSPQTTSLDATPTVPSSASLEPFDCLGGTYEEAGTATTKMTSFQLTVENNNKLPKALGLLIAEGQSPGAIDMTGTAGFYLTGNSLISKFWDETTTSFEVTLQDPDSNVYTLGLPYVKLMDIDLKKTTDIEAIVNFTFEAGVDPTTGVMAYIVKA